MGEMQINQSLVEHLRELRFRIIRCLWGIFIGFAVCYHYTTPIFDFLRAPIQPYLPMGGLTFIDPTEKFFAHIKVAFLCGIILSSPWWVYQIWKFIAPGLYQREKKLAVSFVVAGTGLFTTGVAFTYYAVLPAAFKFLMTYGGDVDKPTITIDRYVSFVLTTALAFGVSFELPLILVSLAMLGVLDQKFLKEKRRYFVVGMAGVAAVITPPDAISMLALLIPMMLLYEASVIIVGMIERKNKKGE